MSNTTIVIVLVVVALAAAAIAALGRGGPRVTTIEHRREHDEKDRDDA